MKPAFTVHSPETGTDYSVYVDVPTGAKTEGPWPTLVFMDGDDQFKFGVAAYHAKRAAQQLPPLLLVGLGYGASYMKPANKRIRDYTPEEHSDDPESGGADAFMAFLTNTFWAALRERYPVREDWRGLAGHSLGSLLVVHAMLRQPAFFTHFLASAPSLWWAERSILTAMAKRWKADPALPARAFFSVGDEDSESMTGDLNLFEAQLIKQPFAGLETLFRRYPNRNHFDVLEDAFGDGMTWLMGTPLEK